MSHVFHGFYLFKYDPRNAPKYGQGWLFESELTLTQIYHLLKHGYVYVNLVDAKNAFRMNLRGLERILISCIWAFIPYSSPSPGRRDVLCGKGRGRGRRLTSIGRSGKGFQGFPSGR